MPVAASPEATAAGLIGTTIHGRYAVQSLIGQGGFGAVYKARHTGTGDTVALKLLRTEQAGSAEAVGRFQREAAATASLRQPHTVRVFDFGQTEGSELFLAMEFLEGKTLAEALERESPMSPERLVHIATQVLKALAEAHSKGIIHRDLKPDNIFLTQIFGEDDFVKVLDFGIAKSLATDDGMRTATGVIIGTPPYMSPEQARGSGVDHRTDLYSLGCILYEGLTGKVPFQAETVIDTLVRRITSPPPDARRDCQVPTSDALCAAVRRAMATAAEDRFADAIAMAKALREALSVPATTTGAAGHPPLPGRPCQRRRHPLRRPLRRPLPRTGPRFRCDQLRQPAPPHRGPSRHRHRHRPPPAQGPSRSQMQRRLWH